RLRRPLRADRDGAAVARAGGHDVGRVVRTVLASHVLRLSIRAQTDQDRMPEPAVRCPLGEPHLAHEPRLDPVVVTALWTRFAERRIGPDERLQLAPQLVVQRTRDAAADARDVPQRAVRVHADVQRAEMTAALGIGVAADHELLALLALELDPVRGALADVMANGALADD